MLATASGMSKNINVNPGQYKTAGRERQGEDINPHKEKAALKTTNKPGRRPGRTPTKPRG
jgi:hypothetical protein